MFLYERIISLKCRYFLALSCYKHCQLSYGNINISRKVFYSCDPARAHLQSTNTFRKVLRGCRYLSLWNLCWIGAYLCFLGADSFLSICREALSIKWGGGEREGEEFIYLASANRPITWAYLENQAKQRGGTHC